MYNISQTSIYKVTFYTKFIVNAEITLIKQLALLIHMDLNNKSHKTDSQYCDVIMGTMASQITSLVIGYPVVHSDADQREQQSCTSLDFVRGSHRWPLNSPHKWPVMRKMFPFDDVIMQTRWGLVMHIFR